MSVKRNVTAPAGDVLSVRVASDMAGERAGQIQGKR
jgi:hypothetical protein